MQASVLLTLFQKIIIPNFFLSTPLKRWSTPCLASLQNAPQSLSRENNHYNHDDVEPSQDEVWQLTKFEFWLMHS